MRPELVTIVQSKRWSWKLKKWLAGQKSEVEDPEEFWNKDDLDDGENKRYKDNDQDDYVPSYDEIVHDSDDDLDEDEKNVEEAGRIWT